MTAVLIGLVVAAVTESAFGQRGRGRRAGMIPDRPGILERPAAIENLFKRAEEGIDRSDWKLAIDSLQRIIDDPRGGLVERKARTSQDVSDAGFLYYTSARDEALQMLAGLPPEGLDAYRVLHDGRARGLFELAVTNGDEQSLQQVVDQYLLTRYGDDAAEMLAGWYLDRSNPVGALALLDRIEGLYPDADVPRWRRLLKRAAALYLLGDSDSALSLLSDGSISLAPAGDPREAWKELRAVIERTPAGLSPLALRRDQDTWPLLGGDNARRNLMPEISPELREGLRWRFALLPTEPDWWETLFIRERKEQPSAPAASAVVGDGRVFVKSLRQVVAMDLESVEPLWIADASAPVFEGRLTGVPVRNQFGFNIYGGSATMTDADRLRYDSVCGNLTVAFSRVFSVEREGAGASPSGASSARSRSFEGTRLVAYSAETGEVVWERGRSGDPADDLGDAYFLSPPIGVRNELWAPYLVRTDLFLGALSPDDGRLIRRMLLCSGDATQLASQVHEALLAASDGQLVYVPTNLGIVVAVDADAFSPRWAVQYPRDAGQRSRGAFDPRSWHACPPVIAGRALIVAPADSAALMALDRNTGEVLWRVDRPDGADYILAADDQSVWLGGRRLFRLQVEDGAAVWHSESLDVTGRAALSGNQIFVPTFSSLETFDAASGSRVLSQALPGDQLPLGNLLCVASALFSVDTNELRKFPDLTLSYPRQLARYQANPDDDVTAVRLAWMELMRDAPEKAFRVLEGVRFKSDSGRQREEEVAGLRVEALLRMASDPGISDEQALDFQRRAADAAQASSDRLRASAALAFKLRDTGKTEEAYLTLWRLGLSDAADGYLTVDEKLRNKGRLVIAEAMRRVGRSLTALELRAIAAQTRQVVQEAEAVLDDPGQRESAVQQLSRIAELDDAGGAAQAALIALSRSELERKRFAHSEQHLQSAVRMNRVAQDTAQALCDLASMYLAPSHARHLEASRLIDRLADEFADQAVELRGADSGAGLTGASAGALLGRRIDEKLASRDAFGERPGRFRFAEGSARGLGQSASAALLLDFDTRIPASASTTMLLYSKPNVLSAFNLANAELDWEARLRLLTGADRDLAEYLGTDEISVYPRVFCDGQIAVINGPQGLFAVELSTGRRLWGIAYEDPDTKSQFALRNRLVAVKDGVMVCAPRRGVLTATSVLDASDVLWERILGGQKLDTVVIEDGMCITLDRARQNATSYSLADGRLLGSMSFRQMDVDTIPVPLVYQDGLLVGPGGLTELICYNVRTGQPAWQLSADDEIRWIFKPGGDYVGFSTQGGGVALVDVYEGRIQMVTGVPQALGGYASGVMHEESLLLMAIQRTNAGDGASLISLDAATGEVRWQRENLPHLGADRYALWRLLTLADDVVPLFVRLDKHATSEFEMIRGDIGIEVVDKSTGETYGPVLNTRRSNVDKQKLTGDFGLWPDRMILDTHSGLISAEIVAETVGDDHVDGRVSSGIEP